LTLSGPRSPTRHPTLYHPERGGWVRYGPSVRRRARLVPMASGRPNAVYCGLESARQPLPPAGGGGKSGLHRAGCQVTPGRREPTESAAESRPPFFGMVRVKGCGKSAPRRWQHRRHGKPHPEQGQIGERSRGPRGSRVGCLRRAATPVRDGWLPTTEPGLWPAPPFSDRTAAAIPRDAAAFMSGIRLRSQLHDSMGANTGPLPP